MLCNITYGEVFILQRIIAYIYRYKGEENIYRKCGNVGFCRVEMLGDRRNINMCFKETHNITKDCEIADIYLEYKEDKNVCRCKKGKMLRNERISGGQMRIKFPGEKEDGLLIICGEERYIVLWDGDKEAIIVTEDTEETVQQIKNTREENIPREEKSKENIENRREPRNKMEDDQLFRAYNRLAKVPMIIGGSMHQVAKIKPQQMIMLPRKYWRLTNNPFLMECCYTHKYILFFKYKGRYAIGVSGLDQENESDYARKFGFEESIRAYDYGKVKGEKMYWLAYLN